LPQIGHRLERIGPRRRLPPINGYRNLIPISKLERRRHPSESDHQAGSSTIRRRQMANVSDTSKTAQEKPAGGHPFVQGVHGVRYLVKDVSRSVAFYTTQLGFTVEHQQLPAFASVSLGDSQILLSGPQASGSRPMPNGQQQEPGGWNRVVLRVTDLPAFIDTLKKAGLHFRNDMETGPGGKQIQVEDPDGNPIELFQPAR